MAVKNVNFKKFFLKKWPYHNNLLIRFGDSTIIRISRHVKEDSTTFFIDQVLTPLTPTRSGAAKKLNIFSRCSLKNFKQKNNYFLLISLAMFTHPNIWKPRKSQAQRGLDISFATLFAWWNYSHICVNSWETLKL